MKKKVIKKVVKETPVVIASTPGIVTDPGEKEIKVCGVVTE